MTGFPGSFPETPRSEARRFQDKTPTANEFRFTPRSQPLYPNIDHLTSSISSGQNQSLHLDEECEKLGYSKKLSNNVLKELDERAAKLTSSHNTKSSVLSPRSSRYNASHRSRFSKMDSIAKHYAAGRNHDEGSYGRSEVDIDKENIPSYDPHSKRSNVSTMSNATKRRKTNLGTKEMHPSLSPSKGSMNLQSILHGSTPLPGATRIPSKSTLQPAFNLEASSSSLNSNHSQSFFNRLTKGTSSLSSKKSTIPSSRTVSGNISKLTTAKKLPRSTTLNNLTKPTASSLSKSTSTRSLRPEVDESLARGTAHHTLPKTKSIHNLKSSSQSKPGWR